MTSSASSSARHLARVMTSHSGSLLGLFILALCQAARAGVDNICSSPLGFQYSNHGSGFHASVSHGNDKDVRLNSRRAWRLADPPVSNLLMINSTRMILLTGLHIQGHERGQGWITGLELETSIDCQQFDRQSYKLTLSSHEDSTIVHLKAMTLTTCVRLKPTQLHGPQPALRLELLGCWITPPTPQSSLRSLDDGGWEMTSEEERLVSWLQLTTTDDVRTSTLTVAYSPDCQVWRFLDSQHVTKNSVPVTGTNSHLITVTLASPVMAKCLRIYSMTPITVSKIDTNHCDTEIKPPNSIVTNDVRAKIESPSVHEDPSMNRLSPRQDQVQVQDPVSPVDHSSLLVTEAILLSQDSEILGEENKPPMNTSGNATQEDEAKQEWLTPESSDTSKTSTEGLKSLKNNKSLLNDALVPSSKEIDKTDKQTEGEKPTNEKSLLKVIYFDDTTAEGELQTTDSDTESGPAHGTQCGVRTVRNRKWQRRRRKRVVSGHRNLDGEWPWLVSLHYLPPIDFTEASGYKHICGASLITDDWLLTAAHCFSNDTLPGLETVSNWELHLGVNDLATVTGPGAQTRGVEGFVRHPRYDRYSDTPTNYDIALIKLSRPVTFTASVSPICLENENFTVSRENCAVSGWGKPTYNGTGTRYGHTAPKTLMSQADCNATYDRLDEKHPFKKFVNIAPDVMCAEVGPNGEDSCLGDSGSPLMCEENGRWFQVGVVAAGYECGHAHFPGIYSRVAYFTDWIRDTMASYESDDL